MGAIKDGNPTSINKWERKKPGTLPSEIGKSRVFCTAFLISGEKHMEQKFLNAYMVDLKTE